MAEQLHKLDEKDQKKEPAKVTAQKRLSASAKALLISALASILLIAVLTVFVVTQFNSKPLEAINWETYSPTLDVYPGANLIASDSSLSSSYKHAWKLYVSKDGLGKIKQHYQDQFIGLGYKQDSSNPAFLVDFYREQSNRCLYVRYGLDVVSLEENRIDLPGVDLAEFQKRYTGQTLFVVHQFDTASREPGC